MAQLVYCPHGGSTSDCEECQRGNFVVCEQVAVCTFTDDPQFDERIIAYAVATDAFARAVWFTCIGEGMPAVQALAWMADALVRQNKELSNMIVDLYRRGQTEGGSDEANFG